MKTFALLCLLCLCAVVAVGCGDDRKRDGERTDCVKLTGAFEPMDGASCSVAGIEQPFRVACVSQTGCSVTVATYSAIYKGTVKGSSFDVSADTELLGFPVKHKCSGKQNENGQLEVSCHITGEQGIDATCDVSLAAQELPANASAVCCDVKAQTCGAGRHCTIVDSKSRDIISACLPVEGEKTEGESCTRTGSSEERGYDDCAPGLYCDEKDGPLSEERVCRKLCTSASDCGSADVCRVYGAFAPRGGTCDPKCTLFGTDCPTGHKCFSGAPGNALDAEGKLTEVPFCFPSGAKPLGALCSTQDQCGRDALCVSITGQQARCMAMCDDAHPCPSAGERCSSQPSISTLFGICQPE